MQVVLVMFRNDGERRSFSVVRNMTVIGRREDCDLRIPVGDVSRKHCRLVRTDDGIRIEDLGSSNGTYVNGERIQESELNAGDTIGVGPVQFVVQIDGEPAEDEMVAPAARAAADDSHASSGAEAGMLTGAAMEELPEEEFQIDEEEPAAHSVNAAHGLGEEPLADEPLEEALSEEDALEEEPLEAEALEEEPLEAEPLEEDPLEELPLAEVPAEEELLEAEPVEAEAEALEEEPLEELEEEHLEVEGELEEEPVALAAEPEELEESALGEHGALSLEEEPLDPEALTEEDLIADEAHLSPIAPHTAESAAEDLEPLEELEAAPSAFPPPPKPVGLDDETDSLDELDFSESELEAHPGATAGEAPLELEPAKPAFGEVDLEAEEELEAHSETSPAKPASAAKEPAPAAEADDSSWDFIIEEPEAGHSAHDFNIDLDSPHQQPHG